LASNALSSRRSCVDGANFEHRAINLLEIGDYFEEVPRLRVSG
jgi:hypothetical protein